ncbi:hypothetical protein [Synechococcus sp. A15-44]|uniref:hypothetical protein n=1 Tax=Synechococcus sp. A15-44 TaxID=1050646 RepID=UPI0016452267|nr:hypothetical protein [Synechococcus sp. A15-44]
MNAPLGESTVTIVWDADGAPAELRAQCGRLARQLAEEHFSQDAVLKSFEKQLLALHD